MFGFLKKQSDRSYHVKLRRASFAKLSLLAERLGGSEQDTLDGIINFAVANYKTGPASGIGNVDLASLVGSGEGDSDMLTQLAKEFGPQIISKFLATPGTGATPGSDPDSQSLDNKDVSKALKDLGL